MKAIHLFLTTEDILGILFVDPTERGKGIRKDLVQHVIEFYGRVNTYDS